MENVYDLPIITKSDYEFIQNELSEILNSNYHHQYYIEDKGEKYYLAGVYYFHNPDNENDDCIGYAVLQKVIKQAICIPAKLAYDLFKKFL